MSRVHRVPDYELLFGTRPKAGGGGEVLRSGLLGNGDLWVGCQAQAKAVKFRGWWHGELRKALARRCLIARPAAAVKGNRVNWRFQYLRPLGEIHGEGGDDEDCRSGWMFLSVLKRKMTGSRLLITI